MARKKQEITNSVATAPQEKDVPVENAQITAETAPTTDTETAVKTKKPRTSIPKEEITLILDAARSTIKFSVIFRGQTISCPKLPSVFAELENPLHQELGAYSVGIKTQAEGESKPKDVVNHYVVGDRAQLEVNPVAMTQGHNHKVEFFHLLALGAISSIPDLPSLSTGNSEKSRVLTIKVVVLSLSDGKALLDKLKPCRWIKVNGIKYRLNFLLNHSLYFAEGYGSAVWGREAYKNEAFREITVFDIGYGTAAETSYTTYGKLPLRKYIETNGGGGLGSLVTFLSRAMARGDSSRLIPTSEVRQILEDSTFENGQVKAIANDGRDVSQALELAIQWWMTDSPLSFALESVSLTSRRQPVILVGGSFAIPGIKERIKERLLKAGAAEEFLVFPPNPETLSIRGMEPLFASEKPTLTVITNNQPPNTDAEDTKAPEQALEA
jgi:hypothetical protein